MPSPDMLVKGEPVMLEAHPFDFLVAELKDKRNIRLQIGEEYQAAQAEERNAEARLREYVERASK